MIRPLGFALVLLSVSPSFAARPSATPGAIRPPHGQAEFPQSAYAACAGKAVGDAATDGAVAGTCQPTKDNRVALRPSGPPPKDAPPADDPQKR